MNNYQKAIKVRKVCMNTKCNNCKYSNKCKKSNIFLYTPIEESIETIAKAIKEENWKVD